MSVLPKKRGAANQQARGSATILHDLSNKGRVLSERVLSGQKRKPSGARHVSRGDMFVPNDDGEANSSFAEDAIHFHENKLTIMLNFEEWIKLSTDNKITSKNSWHFALIDYFHDLNVIKDGDNINFQRALATLDGCVKIYLSRVESAASETGKLLSGLATKRGQMELEEQASDGENDGENDGLEATSNGKKERKINRIVELTLVPFEAIQIKKLDQELAIDPLFKKALAEFDEGGAKSLLLNTLNIDASGRVVFDATTNPMNSLAGENKELAAVSEDPEMDTENGQVLDFSGLQRMLFEDSPDLGSCMISPSMNQLKTVLNDVNKARSILTDVNSKFLAEEEERRSLPLDEQQNFPDYDLGMDFDDNELPETDAARIEEELHNHSLGHGPGTSSGMGHGAESGAESGFDSSLVATREKVLDQDLMAYFDERMKTNWRGPEHWRVTALKKLKTFGPAEGLNVAGASSGTPGAGQADAPPKKHRKEQVLIDFFAEDDDDAIEDMFRKAKNQFQVSKKPAERVSDDLHLLPEDIQFNSKRLVTLFLRPTKTIVTFSKRARSMGTDGGQNGANGADGADGYTDEQYFANRYEQREKQLAEEERQEQLALSFHQAEMEDCENENYGGVDFNDVLDGGDGPLQEDIDDNKDDMGSQLLAGGRKARPEYVNYSRVAKRVDIKLLKDNLWKSIKTEAEEMGDGSGVSKKSQTPEPTQHDEEKQKSFKQVVDVIGTMYRPEEKKDLSTSFCFICLLHLANEHGLSIQSTAEHDNLMITGF